MNPFAPVAKVDLDQNTNLNNKSKGKNMEELIDAPFQANKAWQDTKKSLTESLKEKNPHHELIDEFMEKFDPIGRSYFIEIIPGEFSVSGERWTSHISPSVLHQIKNTIDKQSETVTNIFNTKSTGLVEKQMEIYLLVFLLDKGLLDASTFLETFKANNWSE